MREHFNTKPSLKYDVVLDVLNEDLKKYAWIDAMKYQILLLKKAFHELILWIKTIKMKKILIMEWFHYSVI